MVTPMSPPSLGSSNQFGSRVSGTPVWLHQKYANNVFSSYFVIAISIVSECISISKQRCGFAAKQVKYCSTYGSVGVTMSCLIVYHVYGSWSQGLFRSNFHLGSVVMRNSPAGLFSTFHLRYFLFCPQAPRKHLGQ